MRSIDLNCDMGESFGEWRLGADDALMELVTSANVACGYHAGDPATIERTVKLALEHEVAIGAHPSYPDLSGFGRRRMQIAPDEVESLVLYQVAAVRGIVSANGGALHHVKLHGALYNDAARDPELALAAVRAVQRLDDGLLLYALAGSTMARIGALEGLHVVEEGFVDRRYNGDGALLSRQAEGAVITDPEEAAAQARELALRGRVLAADGASVPVAAATLCVHGDNPVAPLIARRVRETLELAGVQLRSPAYPPRPRRG